MKVAILTTSGQWFVPYARQLADEIRADLYFEHEAMAGNYDVLFILGYHRLMDAGSLQRNKHNLVVHESALPQGKGWAPLFWQVVEGRNDIPVTLFEAGKGIDDGDICLQETLHLDGSELNEELRHKQALITFRLCKRYLDEYHTITPIPQHGVQSRYRKRTPADSELDVHKSIKEQFNLLRTVHNEEYPAFFELNGSRYKLTIEKLSKETE